MRRSKRVQLPTVKIASRLAVVPEIENEEEEVRDVSVYGKSVNYVTPEGDIRCGSPVPPPLPQTEALLLPGPCILTTKTDVQSMQASLTIAKICSNLHGAPLHFWRRQAWVNSSRKNLPVPPAPPPQSQQLSGVGNNQEETEEKADDKGKKDGRTQEQEADAQKGSAAEQNKEDNQQDKKKEDTPLDAVCSPSAATIPFQLQGTYRPPPSYIAAVAEQQQQLAALKGVTEECLENTVGSLAISTSAQEQKNFWLDHTPKVNQFPNPADASKLIQLKQQVEITCCTLYGRAQNKNCNSIQEDLAARHSLLVQILNSGRQSNEEEPKTAPIIKTKERSAKTSSEKKHLEKDSTNK